VVRDELIHDFFEDELILDSLTLSVASQSNTIKNGMTRPIPPHPSNQTHPRLSVDRNARVVRGYMWTQAAEGQIFWDIAMALERQI
jgi:hypothetical protein